MSTAPLRPRREDVIDTERRSQDPTFPLIGSAKTRDRNLALTSRMRTFTTWILSEEENLAGLALLHRELTGKSEGIDSPQRGVLGESHPTGQAQKRGATKSGAPGGESGQGVYWPEPGSPKWEFRLDPMVASTNQNRLREDTRSCTP